MQVAHKLGAGAVARGGLDCDFSGCAGPGPVWLKTPEEKHREKNATPARESFFINRSILNSRLGSQTQFDISVTD
jgi:hypothetical protein